MPETKWPRRSFANARPRFASGPQRLPAPQNARAQSLVIAPQFIKAAGAKGIATLVAEGDS